MNGCFGSGYQVILSVDELRMSRERFRLMTDEEIVADKVKIKPGFSTQENSNKVAALNVILPTQVLLYQHQLQVSIETSNSVTNTVTRLELAFQRKPFRKG